MNTCFDLVIGAKKFTFRIHNKTDYTGVIKRYVEIGKMVQQQSPSRNTVKVGL